MVAVLFTDVEDSTRLWQRDENAASAAIRRHDEIILDAVSRGDGHLFYTGGDGFGVAFHSPLEALTTSVEALKRIKSEDFGDVGGLAVRFGIHSGEVREREGNYYGTTVNTCARLLDVSYGDQIVVTQEAVDLIAGSLPAQVALRDLGRHRLAGIDKSVHIHQVVAPGFRTDFPELRSSEVRPGNLPAELSSLIGREQEVQELAELVTDHRLVTVTGPGGVGKSRLALRVAAQSDQFTDGIWLVDVRSVTQVESLPGAIARTLSLRETPELSATRRLVEHFADRPLLLVLDECEHLRGAVSSLVSELLSRCPGLHVLATSRERLGTEVEANCRIAGIQASPNSVEEGQFAPAVALLREKARLVDRTFDVTSANLDTIVGICEQLDGLPLAIQLAAARFGSYSSEEILARLTHRFALLDASLGGAELGTLESTVSWSFNLLDDAEQTAFLMLCGFVGEFPLERAESLGSHAGLEAAHVDALLARLVEKSMVVRTGRPFGSSYYLLHTVRAFGLKRLIRDGEAKNSQSALARVYADWLRGLQLHRRGLTEARAFDQIDTEHPNLEAALNFALEEEPKFGLDIAVGLWWYWYARGRWAEGFGWLESFADASKANSQAALLAEAYRALATLSEGFQSEAQTEALFDQALQISSRTGDQMALASTLNNSAISAKLHGDYERARSLFEKAAKAAEKAGRKGGGILATVHVNQGSLALVEKDIELADKLFDLALRESRRDHDTHGEASAIMSKGEAEQARGEHRAAIEWFEQAIGLFQKVGTSSDLAGVMEAAALSHRLLGERDRAYGFLTASIKLRVQTGHRPTIADWMELWAGVDLDDGRLEQAALLFGAASSLDRRGAGVTREEVRPRAESDIARLREEFDGFHKKWAEGEMLEMAAAISLASQEAGAMAKASGDVSF